MIPWPIALIIVIHAVVGTVSLAGLVQGMARPSPQLLVPALWLAVSCAAVLGLSGMRPWARRLAVWSSMVMMLMGLAAGLMAAILTPPSARHSLLGTGLASVHLFLVRYLTRPHVRRWFELDRMQRPQEG
jgi:hypothetical protein